MLLLPVFCLILIETCFGQSRAEQHAAYIQFLPMGRTAGRNQVCTKAEEYSDEVITTNCVSIDAKYL